MQLTDFKVISFDCFGTLIDWEAGIAKAYQPLVAKSRRFPSRDQILETHARHEADQQTLTPTLPYSELLGVVHARVGREWGIETSAEENWRFSESASHWPAFADTVKALQYLKQYYKLAILSNTDWKLFEKSCPRLQVEFDYVFTADDIGTYKPQPHNFAYMLDRLATKGIRKHDILHASHSLFHDHQPANKIGLASAWIHRRHAQGGFGATYPPATLPHYDFKFTSLAEMVWAHQKSCANMAKTFIAHFLNAASTSSLWTHKA